MEQLHNSSGVAVKSCQCDPLVVLTDCHEERCTIFFSVFFSLHTIVLMSWIGFAIIMEVTAYQRGPLFRLIFYCGSIASCAKVARTGLLLNVAYRDSIPNVLNTLYNTHLCFGGMGFTSLLFFWARLYHDITNKHMFGRLLPSYITVNFFMIIFFYGQVVAQAKLNHSQVPDYFKLANGFVMLILSMSYFVYGILLRKTFYEMRDRYSLFYQIFLSAIFTSIFLFMMDIELGVSYFVGNTNQPTDIFIVRHSIYEILFILQFMSMQSGFLYHYFKTHVFKPATMRDSGECMIAPDPNFQFSVSTYFLSTLPPSQFYSSIIR